MEGQKEQEETEGLDDLLDEILQKNMERRLDSLFITLLNLQRLTGLLLTVQ